MLRIERIRKQQRKDDEEMRQIISRIRVKSIFSILNKKIFDYLNIRLKKGDKNADTGMSRGYHKSVLPPIGSSQAETPSSGERQVNNQIGIIRISKT